MYLLIYVKFAFIKLLYLIKTVKYIHIFSFIYKCNKYSFMLKIYYILLAVMHFYIYDLFISLLLLINANKLFQLLTSFII